MFSNYRNFSKDAPTHHHSKESGHDHTHEQRSSGDSSGSFLNDISIINSEICLGMISFYDSFFYFDL